MKTANKIILSSLLLVATVGLFSFSNGNDELRYIGMLNNNPVFELKLNNPNEEVFTITITDQYSNVLYKQQVKGSVFNKKFLLNTDEIGNESLRFIITGKKTNVSKVYEVSNESYSVQTPVINQLK
jgi:hypothetical protein